MASIPADTLTKIFNTIDTIIGSFVQTTYHDLVSNNLTAITLIFTLYLIILGGRFLIDHSYSADIGSVTRHLLTVLMIFTLIMSWNWYNALIYNVFTNEPAQLSTIIVNASGQTIPGNSVLQSLDAVWMTGMGAANNLFNKCTGLSSLQFLIYGWSVFLVTLLLCLLALILFIIAKLAMAIMLALGPIFIIFYLFKATKGFMESWIQQLMTFAFIPVITSAIIALMYTLINNTLSSLSPASGVEVTFVSLGEYSLVCLATFVLLLQVYPICSSLGGGVTLRGIKINLPKKDSDLKDSVSGSNESSKSVSGGKLKSSGGKTSSSGGGNSKGTQAAKTKQQNILNAARRQSQGQSQNDTNKLVVVATQNEIKRFG